MRLAFIGTQEGTLIGLIACDHIGLKQEPLDPGPGHLVRPQVAVQRNGQTQSDQNRNEHTGWPACRNYGRRCCYQKHRRDLLFNLTLLVDFGQQTIPPEQHSGFPGRKPADISLAWYPNNSSECIPWGNRQWR